MKKGPLAFFVCVAFVGIFAWEAFADGRRIRSYALFGFERENIQDVQFLESRHFEGAQLRYSWKELEPSEGEYDFASISHDLDLLTSRGKRLFIQIQDVSFDPNISHVPSYLREDPKYHGGADLQYATEGDDDATAKPEGWVARRWDPAVQARMHKLFDELGGAFDGKVEGVVLCETSVGFGTSGALFPEGFTLERYREAIIENMMALKKAFPATTVLQYANFMPGEWLPWEDKGYLKDVYRAALSMGVGVGGPDIQVNKPGQMNHSYPLIRASAEVVPTGVAVQWGNYEEIDTKSGKQVTVVEIYSFARDYLQLDYVFWENQPPFFERDLIPFLATIEPVEP